MTDNSLENYSQIHANRNIRFYLTGPETCPYLPNRLERKVFTTLDDTDAALLNEALTHAGFRRSQNISYRPACDMCSECVSMRIDTLNFAFDAKWRRILAKNADIYWQAKSPMATEEHFNLITRYINARHENGGMSDMNEDDFAAMIEDCAPNSLLFEFRLKIDCELGKENELVAGLIVDELSDGNSLIYSYFKPDFPKYSLGSFIILAQIAHLKTINKPFLYLGYWIKNSPKMKYKSRFKPFQILGNRGWEDFLR